MGLREIGTDPTPDGHSDPLSPLVGMQNPMHNPLPPLVGVGMRGGVSRKRRLEFRVMRIF